MTLPAAEGLTLETITTPEALVAMQEEWDGLLSQSAANEPMLSHLWLEGWWRHFGAGRSLAIGAFRDGGRLVGIAPCCTRNFGYRAGLKFRRLELMGASEGETDSITSEYLGLIAARGHEQRVADAFVEGALGGTFGVWHECVLEMMNGDSPLVGHIEEAFQVRGQSLERVVAMEAPYISLPQDWRSLETSLDKKRRQAVTYAIRDFETFAGKDNYVMRRAGDAASFERGFAILADLHEERWRAAGTSGAFSRPLFTAFHREIGGALLARQRLDLMWLEVGGEPVAAYYLLKQGGDRVLFYQSGRRMQVPKNVRLGIVMMAFAVKDYIALGYKEFDLLGGNSLYKNTFAKSVRPLVRLRVARPSLRETARKSLIAVRNKLDRSAAPAPSPGD